MTANAIMHAPTAPLAVDRVAFTADQRALIQRTYAKGTTPQQFELFIAVAQRLGLDPLARQIYAVVRRDGDTGDMQMAIQIGIDGYRLTAFRTGLDDGQDGPYWCGKDGVWRDAWTSSEPPIAAKVLVYRKGTNRPFVGIARYETYVQRTKDGRPNRFWLHGADHMLAKCAEALALRKAYPSELSGTHSEDERGADAIDVAFSEVPTPPITPRARPADPPPAPAGDPRRTGPMPGPPITDDDLVDLITDIGQLDTMGAIEAMATRLATEITPRCTDQQRARLVAAWTEQRAAVRTAIAGAPPPREG